MPPTTTASTLCPPIAMIGLHAPWAWIMSLFPTVATFPDSVSTITKCRGGSEVSVNRAVHAFVFFDCETDLHSLSSLFFSRTNCPALSGFVSILRALPCVRASATFVSGIVDDATEGRPRDLHFPGCVFVVVPFVVGEPDGLQLVEAQTYLLQFHERDALWFEVTGIGYSSRYIVISLALTRTVL